MAVNNVRFSEEPIMSKRNVVHVEIPTMKVESTAKFYQDLFGWKITALQMNRIDIAALKQAYHQDGK